MAVSEKVQRSIVGTVELIRVGPLKGFVPHIRLLGLRNGDLGTSSRPCCGTRVWTGGKSGIRLSDSLGMFSASWLYGTTPLLPRCRLNTFRFVRVSDECQGRTSNRRFIYAISMILIHFSRDIEQYVKLFLPTFTSIRCLESRSTAVRFMWPIHFRKSAPQQRA